MLMLAAAAAATLTVLVLMLAVLHWFRSQPGLTPGNAAWRRGDAPGLLHTLGWLCTIALGLLTTAVLVVLAAALTWQVATGMLEFEGALTASAGAAPRFGPEPKDAVSNAMTAVALVVTAVTLVLTLGTTWLGRQQRTLEIERAKLAKAMREVAQWKAFEDQRRRVHVLRLRATDAAKDWAIAEGASPDMLLSQVMTIANQLEVLSTDDREQRGRSFDVLAQFFDGEDSQSLLAPVRDYCEACHQLAITRAWNSGDIANPADLARFLKEGQWCRLFDEEEVRIRIGRA